MMGAPASEKMATVPPRSKGAASDGESAGRWLTMAQVAERFQVHRRTLERLMLDTHQARAAGENIPIAWVGGGRQKSLIRWNPRKVEPWFEAICGWRDTQGATESASPPAPREHRPRKRREPPSDSTQRRSLRQLVEEMNAGRKPGGDEDR